MQLQVSAVATRLATYLCLLSASQCFRGKGASFQVVITDSHYLSKNEDFKNITTRKRNQKGGHRLRKFDKYSAK